MADKREERPGAQGELTRARTPEGGGPVSPRVDATSLARSTKPRSTRISSQTDVTREQNEADSERLSL